MHLRSVELKHDPASLPERFPFSIRAVRGMTRIAFTTPVTFFVGENGSGKSTLLEALATATGLPTVGTAAAAADVTLRPQQDLGAALRLTWNRRTARGFFLRAEDFFGFARAIEQMKGELQRRIAQVEAEYAGRSELARSLALGPLQASLTELQSSYGAGLDSQSHGEGFLALFQRRFVPGGLYLLDESEAPLSPQSQLGLIALVKAMVQQQAQFIVATHSPILLAFPGATIYSFDESPAAPVAFGQLEHVNLTRDFLNNPDAFLRRL